MTTLNNLIGLTEKETRRNAIKFARENNYKVAEMYKEAKAAWCERMAIIHKNGKTGNYEEANRYYDVVDALKSWA